MRLDAGVSLLPFLARVSDVVRDSFFDFFSIVLGDLASYWLSHRREFGVLQPVAFDYGRQSEEYRRLSVDVADSC